MMFPRILSALAAISLLAVLAACGGGSSNQPVQKQPPPPPTGTNYTTCDNQQVPNWQSNLFISNYQPAIQAVVSHYGSSVGYIRVGLGKGGEINLPQGWDDSSSGACYGGYTAKWGYTAGSPSSTWNTYLGSMVQFEGGLGSAAPLLVSITPITDVGTEPDDYIAPIAVQNGMSFGNQGLESSDISNYPNCGGDWCNLFAQLSPQIAELQTLGQSCPSSISNSCPNNLSSSTGPLPPLLQFATAHGANDLEIYYQDWLIAYDTDYAGSLGVSSSDQSAYQAAIQAAAAVPGVKLQVLFPPQSTDTTMCGSQTCYNAVLNLASSPYVTGFVVDIDWSDFQPNDATDPPDWTITDGTNGTNGSVSTWIATGKTVNLVLQNTTYGGSGSCPSTGIGSNGNVASNCAMPQWMWTVLQ